MKEKDGVGFITAPPFPDSPAFPFKAEPSPATEFR